MNIEKSTVYKIGIGLIIWSVVLFFVDINAIAVTVGVQNVYILLFFIALTAGTSFLTSASFYAFYLSYISAGFDPMVLGVIGGIGMSFGDLIYFLFARKFAEALSIDRFSLYRKIFRYVSQLPQVGVYVFTFFYAAFAPIPNDILMITLGILRFRFQFVAPVVILGNVVLLTLIAYGINISLF